MGMITGLAQIGIGFSDRAAARKMDRESEALHKAIPGADPGVLNHLNDIRLRERFASSGNSRTMAFQRRMAMDADNQFAANAARGAGGAPGTYQDMLLRGKVGTQQALMGAGAQEAQRGMQLLAMQTPLIQDIADRTLSLQTYLRDKRALQAATREQSANNMISSGFGTVAGSMGGMGGGGSKGGSGSSTIGSFDPKKYNAMPSVWSGQLGK